MPAIPATILVPVDFSTPSTNALDYAAALAGKLGATVHLVHAVGLPLAGMPEAGIAWLTAGMAQLVASAEHEVAELARARAAIATFGAPRVVTGDPRDAILAAAEALHADLVVMGTHGRRGIARAVLGSTAEAIVRTAPCPVLTVRARGR